MNVGLLNERITFQKNTVVSDRIGNRTNSWEDYYSCACTVGGEYGIEKEAAAQTVEHTDISFTVRYCNIVNAVTAEGFRIAFRNCIYNIVSVDHMNYKKKSIKFRCRKV